MKDTKKDGKKIDEIIDAVANDAAMWSRIAIDAASAAANADKNDNNKDTWRIGKIITLEGGIFRPGTASYEAEKKKLLQSLAEQGNPEMQNMVEEISKQDEADKNDNKKKAKKTKHVHCAGCKTEWELTGMEMNGPCKNLAGGGCEKWLSWGPLPGEQADDENGKNAGKKDQATDSESSGGSPLALVQEIH